MFDVPLFWSTVAHMNQYEWDIEGAGIAKALGGCGVHNAMLYVRALQEDIEKWNVTTWDWETVLAYYKQLENFLSDPSGKDVDTQIHGINGPMTTSPPPYVDEVSPYFLEACKTKGYQMTNDFNRPNNRLNTAGFYHFNIRDGVRDSAAKTMLSPLLFGPTRRPN